MDSGQSFYVRRCERIFGPFVREQLRELAAGRHIDAATEVATSPDGPWAHLESLPALRAVLRGDEPAAFERANHDAQPSIDLHDLIAAANNPRPPAGIVSPTVPPPVSAPHDVRSILAFNLAIEKRLGLHRVKPPPARRSRRRLDYFVLMAGIGFAIFATLLVESYIAVQVQVLAAHMPDQFWPVFNAVLFHSPIFAWGLAAFATFAIALGWLMFGLMDDY
ncbi:MAG TPA: hypothetical protein VG710_02755 [Opitutus sp.]|nr:hypothetical protein [Opitutus sp.]